VVDAREHLDDETLAELEIMVNARCTLARAQESTNWMDAALRS
jgi:hypothetical protein